MEQVSNTPSAKQVRTAVDKPGDKPLLFFSYSKDDSSYTRELYEYCKATERYRCWMAPMDIPAGENYPQAIAEALKECFALVLIYSSSTALSRHVQSEVLAAFNNGKRIIPIRTEPLDFDPRFAHMLSAVQWIDAFPKTPNSQIPDTEESIFKAINRDGHRPLPTRPSEPAPSNMRRVALVLSMIGGISVLAYLFVSWNAGKQQSTHSSAKAPPALVSDYIRYETQLAQFRQLDPGQGMAERISRYNVEIQNFKILLDGGRHKEAEAINLKLVSLAAEILSHENARNNASKVFQATTLLREKAKAAQALHWFPAVWKSIETATTAGNSKFDTGAFADAQQYWLSAEKSLVGLIESASSLSLGTNDRSLKITFQSKENSLASFRTRIVTHARDVLRRIATEHKMPLDPADEDRLLDANPTMVNQVSTSEWSATILVPVPALLHESLLKAISQSQPP